MLTKQLEKAKEARGKLKEVLKDNSVEAEMSFGPTFAGPARPGPTPDWPGPARTVIGPKIFGPARPGPARASVTVSFPQNF